VSFPLQLRPGRESKLGVRLPDSASPRLCWKGPALDGARPLAIFGRVQLPLRQPGGIEVESLHWSAPRIPGESQWLLPNAADEARVFRSGAAPRSIAIDEGASLTEFDAALDVECSVELDSGGAEIASVSAWRHGLQLCATSGFEVDRFHPRVSVLTPSKWRVQLDEAREWGFEVRLSGGGTHTGRARTRLGGLERVELHERASDALATLSGRAVDANGVPLAGARVLLSAQQRWTSADASGAFTFPSLDFGSHTVTAWRDGVCDEQPLVARQEVVLARFADPVLLTLEPAAAFDVRVQVSREPAPAGTELLCLPIEGYGDSACLSSLATGAFRFTPTFGNRFAFVPLARSLERGAVRRLALCCCGARRSVAVRGFVHSRGPRTRAQLVALDARHVAFLPARPRSALGNPNASPRRRTSRQPGAGGGRRARGARRSDHSSTGSTVTISISCTPPGSSIWATSPADLPSMPRASGAL